MSLLFVTSLNLPVRDISANLFGHFPGHIHNSCPEFYARGIYGSSDPDDDGRLKFLSFLQFHFVAFLPPPPPPPWPVNTIEACFEIASSNLLTGRHERHILNYAAADPTKRTNSPSSSFRSKRGILSLMPCKKRNVDKDDGIH